MCTRYTNSVYFYSCLYSDSCTLVCCNHKNSFKQNYLTQGNHNTDVIRTSGSEGSSWGQELSDSVCWVPGTQGGRRMDLGLSGGTGSESWVIKQGIEAHLTLCWGKKQESQGISFLFEMFLLQFDDWFPSVLIAFSYIGPHLSLLSPCKSPPETTELSMVWLAGRPSHCAPLHSSSLWGDNSSCRWKSWPKGQRCLLAQPWWALSSSLGCLVMQGNWTCAANGLQPNGPAVFLEREMQVDSGPHSEKVTLTSLSLKISYWVVEKDSFCPELSLVPSQHISTPLCLYVFKQRGDPR
jgi:hypothetical protein